MAFLKIKDNAGSSLLADITNVATSLVVIAGEGALFPTDNFVVTIENEKILVTTRTDNIFDPITRGYNGTTGVAHTVGKAVELRPIALHITELQNEINTHEAATVVHGATGAVVGTTNAQTLTNKTLTDPKITTSINAQTGTTYTLVLTDASKLVTLGNAAAIAVTIPTNASVAFPIGAQIDCIQILAGKVTFSGAGVTINSKSGNKSISTQWVGVTLIKTNTDIWSLLGDLVA